MALRLVDNGKKWVIERTFALLTTPVQLRYHLYQNNHTPSQDDTIGNYTEATFSGYASVLVGSWSVPATSAELEITSASSAIYTVAPAPSVSNNIYGYYVTDDQATGLSLLWAELFAGGPLPMAVAGTTIIVIPSFSMTSQFA